MTETMDDNKAADAEPRFHEFVALALIKLATSCCQILIIIHRGYPAFACPEPKIGEVMNKLAALSISGLVPLMLAYCPPT